MDQPVSESPSIPAFTNSKHEGIPTPYPTTPPTGRSSLWPTFRTEVDRPRAGQSAVILAARDRVHTVGGSPVTRYRLSEGGSVG